MEASGMSESSTRPGVHTLSGIIDPGEFAFALPHEHLICDFSPVTKNNDHILNDEALAIEELGALAARGRGCLVEISPPDLGRDAAALRRIQDASGIDIVMGTGWYRSPFYPPALERATVNDIADGIVAELVEGVPLANGAFARAGIIGEIGADGSFVNGIEERVLRACARASLRTGAPISTHAVMYPVGVAQLDILREEGADVSRVVIGHADTFLDVDYHRAILDRGAWLQFDTCGRTHLNPDSRRADFLVDLIRAGRLDRLLISSDRCFRSDLTAFGGAGYAWTLDGFVPLLRDRGISEEEIDQLIRVNPLRMLTW